MQNGNFQVILQGQGDTSVQSVQLESAVKDLGTAYVEIKVGSEAPLVPRQPLLRSPFASVDKLIGAVMFFAGPICPTGWILANGANLPPGGVYVDLFNYLQYSYGQAGSNFVLPNLMDGSFIRGTGGNAAALGVKQGDAFQGHFHKVGRRDGFPEGGWGFEDGRQLGPYVNSVSHKAGSPAYDMVAMKIENDGTNGDPNIASETRPKNYAMTPCIKY